MKACNPFGQGDSTPTGVFRVGSLIGNTKEHDDASPDTQFLTHKLDCGLSCGFERLNHPQPTNIKQTREPRGNPKLLRLILLALMGRFPRNSKTRAWSVKRRVAQHSAVGIPPEYGLGRPFNIPRCQPEIRQVQACSPWHFQPRLC